MFYRFIYVLILVLLASPAFSLSPPAGHTDVSAHEAMLVLNEFAKFLYASIGSGICAVAVTAFAF